MLPSYPNCTEQDLANLPSVALLQTKELTEMSSMLRQKKSEEEEKELYMKVFMAGYVDGNRYYQKLCEELIQPIKGNTEVLHIGIQCLEESASDPVLLASIAEVRALTMYNIIARTPYQKSTSDQWEFENCTPKVQKELVQIVQDVHRSIRKVRES